MTVIEKKAEDIEQACSHVMQKLGHTQTGSRVRIEYKPEQFEAAVREASKMYNVSKDTIGLIML